MGLLRWAWWERFGGKAMNILCAVDGSSHSRWALETLEGFCALSDCTLILVHVVEVGVPYPSRGLADLELPEDRGENLLAQIRQDVVSPHWRAVHTAVLRGRAADAIIRTAAGRNADLIVLGSRGRSDVASFLLGSVSRRVVMYAPCSVLVVKTLVSEVSRVVVGTDGSEEAQAAVEFLCRLPWRRDMAVTVVSVIPPLPLGMSSQPVPPSGRGKQVLDLVEKEAERAAGQTAERLRQDGFDATAVVAHGQPAYELIQRAQSGSAELIVIGSRGITGETRYLMGSVSDGVVLYAPCAVLVFRQQEGEQERQQEGGATFGRMKA